jgi:nitroreductase
MQRPAKTDFPIHDLLRERWSPRAFDARLIEPAKVKSLLEAARWAASSYNEQPWAFIVGTKDQPAQYASVLECLIEFNQGWARSAPMLLLTVAHLQFEKNGQPNRHAYHDVGLAMGNLSAQATAEGLLLHQMAGILPDRAKQVFAIPDGWEAVTGVAIGYPGDPATLPDPLRERELAERTRKPAASFVFAGKWGTTLGLLSGK